jgi:cellulose synthase/poly-beta-1,6-N-acetylglucosamine synthase-like glycosyltransferase
MMGSYFRHALASINAFFVTPGPFSVYRRAILLEIGGFRFGQQTEDMDIAMRLLKRGYHIENAPGALVTTRAQDTFGKLVRQRMRWASGYFRNIWFDHRDLVSSKYGFLGLFVLPLGFATPALMIGTALLSLYLFTTGVAGFVLAHRGIPVLWSLSSLDRHLSWFYLPINGLTLLAFVVLILAALSAALGKYISGTKEGFARGIILYTLFYGFLAPVWYARSIYDVSTGTRRGWRD